MENLGLLGPRHEFCSGSNRDRCHPGSMFAELNCSLPSQGGLLPFSSMSTRVLTLIKLSLHAHQHQVCHYIYKHTYAYTHSSLISFKTLINTSFASVLSSPTSVPTRRGTVCFAGIKMLRSKGMNAALRYIWMDEHDAAREISGRHASCKQVMQNH